PDSTIKQGGAYNIYCVMVPQKVKTLTPKPNKLTFTLIYQSDDRGKIVNVNYTNNSSANETAHEKLTKVLAASKVTYPYSEYGLESTNVKFKVNSNVTAKETSVYTRELLIDCIIFEPVR